MYLATEKIIRKFNSLIFLILCAYLSGCGNGKNVGGHVIVHSNKPTNSIKLPQNRKAISHISRFNQQDGIQLFDNPRGRKLRRVHSATFPALKDGVPVYALKDGFLEVLYHNGGTVWINELVAKVRMRPCANRSGTGSQKGPKPVGNAFGGEQC